MTLFRYIRNCLINGKYLVPALVFCALASLVFHACSKTECTDPSIAKALMEQGDSCRLEWKYKKALGFYQQAYDNLTADRNADLQLELLVRIMRTHDVLRHWKEMPESSYRLYTLAKERGDSVHTAMALFMRGKRLFTLGQRQAGLQVASDATEMLKRTGYAHKDHELSQLYAVLAKLYSIAGDYDEAMQMSQEQERYTELARKCHPDEWYRRNLRRVQIIRVEILSKMGRMAEADSIYEKYDIQPDTDPLCGDALLCYYRLSGKNAEILKFLNTARRNIDEDGDSMGRNMQRLLRDMGDFYISMEDYPQAAEYYASTSRIADTLAARSLNNLTVEVQKVIDNERYIASQTRGIIIIVSGLVLLALIFFFSLHQALVVRKRNRKMTAVIDQLMRYRNIVLQNGDNTKKVTDAPVDASDEELRHFREVDKHIMKECLFTDPDFGRDDLMRLLGVDKNALPALLNKMAHTNVSGYIINKRMEYAVSLMKEHPEYTLESIADACGIKSSATFIRNFKAVYDMTPSEFRRQLELNADE